MAIGNRFALEYGPSNGSATPEVQDCPVSAATRYLIQHVHPMWDVHESDTVIHPQTMRLTFLDVFMEPNEVSGCLYTLPPELRAGGPNRRQAIGELGSSIAARVNGFVAALLFANLLLPHLSLQVVGGEQGKK